MTTPSDDGDDVVDWIGERLHQFNASSEAASMDSYARAGVHAEIFMEGLNRLEEPMRTEVAHLLLARCEQWLSAQH